MGNQASSGVYTGAPPPRKGAPLSDEDMEEAWKLLAARVPNRDRKRRVAIVGSGVTGLGAAYHLVTSCAEGEVEVVVYESNPTPGGHAHTEWVTDDKGQRVACDCGFMVFNHQNYPNMVELFAELGVEDEDTNMSFAVSMDGGAVEWCSDSVQTLKGAVYVRMIRDMLRFNASAAELLKASPEDPQRKWSVAEFLKQGKYGPEFATYYIVPMCAALWSSSAADVLASSAYAMVAFMDNHCMLQLFHRPQWKTVKGRSTVYVEKIAAVLGDRLRCSQGVKKVAVKSDGRKEVTDSGYRTEVYDEVVFACHPDQALSLLEDGPSKERARPFLERFKYAPNVMYLHSDERLMPTKREAWGSWNYIGTTGEVQEGRGKPVFVTYWLNQLQNLQTDKMLFVSLNPTTEPDPALTHKVLHEGHPQFTPETEAAQRLMTEGLQGKDGLWYCGAWMGHGFHEDGLRSGLEVATAISGKRCAWMAPEASTPYHPLSKARLNDRTLVQGFQDWLGQLAAVPLQSFLRRSIKAGRLVLRMPGTGTRVAFGDAAASASDTVTLVVKDWWFFVRVALEYDLGLARAYMAGEFEVEGTGWNADGLTRLFWLFIKNRDHSASALNVSALLTSWVGYALNFLRYRLSMDNSLAGSRHNIAAHYDIGNDLYTLMLDSSLMMYSSAIYDLELSPTTPTPPSTNGSASSSLPLLPGSHDGGAAAAALGSSFPVPAPYRYAFKGTLEDAQLRKVDTLIRTCRVEAHHTLLDIGFGWGGIALRAAETIGCKVVGITLSKEQKALAEAKVRSKGLGHLITFELVDYRVFAKRHPGEFDRIISCEMIEAVGHQHLGEYFSAVGRLLKPGGIFVMEAITTPESRYKEYLKSTDFINTIVFPGSCCPSLHALLDAMYHHSPLSLEGFINIDVHYAETLREWRRRFNRHLPTIKRQGFDDVFIRCWNYYLCYCEAGFDSKTEGCLILTFSRPGNMALLDNTPCRIVPAAPPTPAPPATPSSATERVSAAAGAALSKASNAVKLAAAAVSPSKGAGKGKKGGKVNGGGLNGNGMGEVAAAAVAPEEAGAGAEEGDEA